MPKLEDFLISEKQFEKLHSLNDISKQAREGKPFRDILGVNEEVLKKYFSIASNLHEKKRYSEAKDAFLFLCVLDPTISNFWQGLGLAEHCQENYAEALQAYVMGLSSDPDNPSLLANTAQCYLALGEKKAAEETAKEAIEICGNSNEYASIKAALEQFNFTT